MADRLDADDVTTYSRQQPMQSYIGAIYIIEKKLQFITLLTAIVHRFTHRKQQK